MFTIGPLSEYPNEGIYEVKLQGQAFLLIKHNNQYYCVEDKCGHFGMPLAKGKVKDTKIYCPVHNISFDLNNGQVVNHMGEDCEPIRALKVIEKDEILFCSDGSAADQFNR